MMMVVRKNGQVTIPASIRKKACLEEGSILEAEFRNGKIVLRPLKLIDATVFRNGGGHDET